ncbi:fasciclin domain-containing protein [Vacuolonema iberomarrocanum]|uniref:fasciclin domain-containing protein n=1 Tax=Vacuolonema iberomarrocanum TaxID=3454632 RepID=UPI003F6E004C
MTYKMQTLQKIALAALCGVGIAISPAIANSATPADQMENESRLIIAQEPGTIVDVASGNEDFETLVAAVQAADLVDDLSSEGPFTVFAPTDDAFDLLPDDVLAALLEPENEDLLTDILLYHVVPDEVTSDELESGGLDTLNGGLAIAVEPDNVVVNNASVVLPDVDASNGVIHAINRVLVPPGTLAELESRMAEDDDDDEVEPIPGLW